MAAAEAGQEAAATALRDGRYPYQMAAVAVRYNRDGLSWWSRCVDTKNDSGTGIDHTDRLAIHTWRICHKQMVGCRGRCRSRYRNPSLCTARIQPGLERQKGKEVPRRLRQESRSQSIFEEGSETTLATSTYMIKNLPYQHVRSWTVPECLL